MAAIAFVTTAWGPRHGGINAFNADLCLIKSGPIAVEVAKLRNSRAAVVQHTDHISYAALKGSPGEAMIDRNLGEIDTLARAAAVFGVGPVLADAARDRVRGVGKPVTELVPGLATIPPLPMPKPFRPITFGRLDPIADMIKQGRLAVRAFAQLLREAPDIVGASPRMTVVGIDPGASEEEGLRQLARERVGYDVSIVGHPFTKSRERLFRVLADASACLMLSVHEGFGLAGWEAIAAEVPLVLSRASGLHLLLDERYHGGRSRSCMDCRRQRRSGNRGRHRGRDAPIARNRAAT